MEEGHDVERVAEIHKNPSRCENVQRNVRDKMRELVGVRITVAKQMLSTVTERLGSHVGRNPAASIGAFDDSSPSSFAI